MIKPKDSQQGAKRERTRDELLASVQMLLLEYNAADLRIRQITEHAGLVHSSFYNYYPDISSLITDLSKLLGATHAAMMMALTIGTDCPAVRFARITRQTLQVAAHQPNFGRLLFDVGLPIDRFGKELRMGLAFDLMDGVSRGIFDVPDIELTTSILSGAVRGLSFDLHRGDLSAAKIDAVTAQFLRGLGVKPAEAERLAFAPMEFAPQLEFPMRWLALPPELSMLLGGLPPAGGVSQEV